MQCLLEELQKPEGSSTQKHYGLSLIKDRPNLSELLELSRGARQMQQSAPWLVAMHTMQERLMLAVLSASDAELESLRAQMRNFQQFQAEMNEMAQKVEALEQATMTEQEKVIAKRSMDAQIENEWVA